MNTLRTRKTSRRAGWLAGAMLVSGLALAPGAANADPFASLRVVVARDKLPPIRTVRARREKTDAKRRALRVTLSTRPPGAKVKWGRKTVGKTPVTLTVKRDRTPMDLTVRRAGYRVLYTRVQRNKTRKYFFKLTPR